MTKLKTGSRIQTARGDVATVMNTVRYTGGKTRLIVRWDDSPSVTQGRTISYHSRYGNSVWMSDVTDASTQPRIVQTADGTASINAALQEAIQYCDDTSMTIEPVELVETAIETGLLEVTYDRDFLRCVDLAQDILNPERF